MTFFSSDAKAASSKNTGILQNPGPIYHDTSEEQKRAQAYIIAGYVPFGHHFEKATENSLKTNSQNVCDPTFNLQDLYLNQPDSDSLFEFDEEYPYYSDEQDPYLFDTGSALPDLIADLSAIKREKRDYTGRIDHIIRLNKKEKVQTDGRIQSTTLVALTKDQGESSQKIPSVFASKRDPKAAIGKMASSVHVGVVGANDRNAGEGSHQGSLSSMAQSQGGGAILHSSFKISDLIHPSLNDPLKTQQQVTFRLVKTGRANVIILLSITSI